MSYDYLIIGAGSAGCVLANRLSEDPSCSVLLIEAGGKGPLHLNIPGAYGILHRSKVDWGFHTEPQLQVNNRSLYIPRGKVLGGCSSTNAMAYVRGNSGDYNEWSALGNKGWSYDEVLPYFKKSEQHELFGEPYHSRQGLLPVSFAKSPSPLSRIFLEACEECGIPRNEDYNGANQSGAGMLQYTIKKNKRQSTAVAFLFPVLYRKNLKVLTNTLVKQILLEKEKAIGVEVVTGNSISEKILCNKEVIVSAGAVKSPQLLLLSGIGERNQLENAGIDLKLELPGVGNNLQDHIWTFTGNLSNISTANHDLKPLMMMKGLFNYLFFKKGAFANSPIETNAFLKTDPASDRPDIQFHFAPFHTGDDYKTDLYNIQSIPKTNGFTILAILLHPESKGTVTVKSKDPNDHPILQPNFLRSDKDRKTLLSGLKKAMEVADAKAFRKYSPEGLHHPLRGSSDEQLMEHIRKSLETLYHPVGTCKMGNDEQAVVNDRLEVHGISGLRVIDASIMPTIVSGNTNAASIMIGEKGADLVKAGR